MMRGRRVVRQEGRGEMLRGLLVTPSGWRTREQMECGTGVD
jgi:hypothetical protein